MIEILTMKKEEKVIEKEFGCEFVRINPDENDYILFKATNEIDRYINIITERSLIDKIFKKILRIRNSVKSLYKIKIFKVYFKKIFPSLQNIQTYCLSCKKNFEKSKNTK